MQNAHQLKLTIDQVQKEDGRVPPAYRLPLEIYIHHANRSGEQITQRNETIRNFFDRCSAKPTKLEVDKNEKVALKSVKIK